MAPCEIGTCGIGTSRFVRNMQRITLGGILYFAILVNKEFVVAMYAKVSLVYACAIMAVLFTVQEHLSPAEGASYLYRHGFHHILVCMPYHNNFFTPPCRRVPAAWHKITGIPWTGTVRSCTQSSCPNGALCTRPV